MAIGRFIAGIAALLRRPSDGKYLLLQRSADKDFGAGAWECVTGRVDQGESFTDALYREVREELGVEVQIDFPLGTTHFYRGEPLPENELLGVGYCCTIDDSQAIATSWEHARHHWASAEEAAALFPEDYWLQVLIRRAEAVRALSPPELLAFYRAEGFEF